MKSATGKSVGKLVNANMFLLLVLRGGKLVLTVKVVGSIIVNRLNVKNLEWSKT